MTLIKNTIYQSLSEHYDILKESDLVLDKSSLVEYLKSRLLDYIDSETDIDRLSDLMQYALKKNVTRRGNRYVVSPEVVAESIITQLGR